MKECNKEYIYLKTLCRPILYKTTYRTDNECPKTKGSEEPTCMLN